MGPRAHRILAWTGFGLLIVLHHDFWRGAREGLLFGWIPSELAYRLIWMIFAWGYLLYFTRFVWRSGEASP